ncbi:hypothetical protein BN946_scf184962.g42 [Trametes cinnabarina]|uniref:DUF7918 domain-containing protein n=1 Tax=Pycnoporus cinnabarinus TaxID=5643 RepID=A0A060SIN5_PYCCI|nr:hypothetical protein BN946_scf184962.g42 [Trametes cinnabarina]
MTRVERYVCSDRAFGVVEVHDIGPVHEKCKKAGVHTVSFGEAVEEESNNVNEVDFIGVEKEPFATFIFRYRPLNMLQANGIAPLPPKAAKKRSSDQLDTKSSRGGKKCRTEPEVKHEPKVEDDEDEEAEDLAFLEEQLAMMQRRVEEKRAARRAKTVMKREPSPIHVPSSFTDEVIDLTSD